MTTKDNKLSCQSSSSSESSIPNQVLLQQQCNNNSSNMKSYSNNGSAAISALTPASAQNNTLAASNPNNAALQSTHSKMANSASSSQHGRWTKEEHHKFIDGINKYGKNWKKVEEHIGTRSGAQIRSHAQKFFNRLEKEFGKTSILKDMQTGVNACESSVGGVSSGLGQNTAEMRNSLQNQLFDINSAIHPEYAQQLLKIERQQDFYEDITPMISNLNSSPESDLHQNPLHNFSQNNSVSLNVKPQENTEAPSLPPPPKKKDWSKILSAQEKLRQTACSNNSNSSSNQIILNKKEKKQMMKNEKKMAKQLTQLLDQQCQHLTQNIPYDNQGHKEIDFDSLNTFGMDQEVSPSDFISQSLLNSIFEPADIETHLIQFYIAQMNLEQLINQKRQLDLDEISPYMQNQIKKKKLSVDSISTMSANQNSTLLNNRVNNVDNISCSQLSHSTAISTTSPSSQVFQPHLNQQNIAQSSQLVQQPHHLSNQPKPQDKTSQLPHQKQQNEDISQISEYQQSLLLFNILSSLQAGQQDNIQTNIIDDNNSWENNNFNAPINYNKINQSFNQSTTSQPAIQAPSEDMEAELIKHLILSLQQKQTEQFNESQSQQFHQQQHQQQQYKQVLSQKENNLKMGSACNFFNQKNEQIQNPKREDVGDENDNFSQLEQQLMSVFSQQLATSNGCSAMSNYRY